MIEIPARYAILVVDDEPDVHAVTRLSLKGLVRQGRGVDILTATSGREAVEIMTRRHDIAVVLLDVVMETDDAGLQACRSIRMKLANKLTRIILRTGQPGTAPERETIDTYDVDGYLPKADLSSTRLYTSVRTALKAWHELVELERHRRMMEHLHEVAVALSIHEPIEETLGRVAEAALRISAASASVLYLQVPGKVDARMVHRAGRTRDGQSASVDEIDSLAQRIRVDLDAMGQGADEYPIGMSGGWHVPLVLPRSMGRGFLFLYDCNPDGLAQGMLPVLASHAVNALYASLALRDTTEPALLPS